jgi:hypothetical protein
MTVARAIITLIETLPPHERQEVATWIKEHENTPLSQEEYLRRKSGLAKFAGILKDYQDYKPSKSEFYEQ